MKAKWETLKLVTTYFRGSDFADNRVLPCVILRSYYPVLLLYFFTGIFYFFKKWELFYWHTFSQTPKTGEAEGTEMIRRGQKTSEEAGWIYG